MIKVRTLTIIRHKSLLLQKPDLILRFFSLSLSAMYFIATSQAERTQCSVCVCVCVRNT